MIRPLNNQALIEIIDEYSGVAHGENETQVGILRDLTITRLHLTASTGFEMSEETALAVMNELKLFIGKTVRYQLYADADSGKFPDGDKEYVLIPWYRISGVEPEGEE